MMESTFWFGAKLGTFIFPGFEVNSTIGIIFTCLGVFSFSMISEAARALLLSRARGVHLVPPDENTSTHQPSIMKQRIKESLPHHAIETLSYILYITTSYLLMLAIMSYNGAIFISIILGSGIGYLIFRSNSIQNNKSVITNITKCDDGSAEPLTRELSVEAGPSSSDMNEMKQTSSNIDTSVIVHKAPDSV